MENVTLSVNTKGYTHKEIIMRAWRMTMIVAFAPFFFITVSAVSTWIATDYNLLSDNMSKLSGPGAQHPWVFQLGVVGYALLIQCLGPLLYWQAGQNSHGALLWGLVIIYSLIGIMAAVFRDGYNTLVIGEITENTVHYFAARISFSAVWLLTFVTPWVLRHQEGWLKWKRLSVAIGIITTILVIPFVAEIWPSYQGLIQRLFFATTMLWILVTAIKLNTEILYNPAHHSGKARPRKTASKPT